MRRGSLGLTDCGSMSQVWFKLGRAAGTGRRWNEVVEDKMSRLMKHRILGSELHWPSLMLIDQYVAHRVKIKQRWDFISWSHPISFSSLLPRTMSRRHLTSNVKTYLRWLNSHFEDSNLLWVLPCRMLAPLQFNRCRTSWLQLRRGGSEIQIWP